MKRLEYNPKTVALVEMGVDEVLKASGGVPVVVDCDGVSEVEIMINNRIDEVRLSDEDVSYIPYDVRRYISNGGSFRVGDVMYCFEDIIVDKGV